MRQARIDPRRFRLFDAIAEPQLLPLRRVARVVIVPRRQRIYSAGDASDRVLLLEAGIVKVTAPLPPGPDVLLAFLYPGDVFGELAIIDDGPRDHATEAHEDARVWSVGRGIVLDLLGQSPALGFAFFRLMARDTRRFRMRVEELLQKDAHSRVARTLLNLAAEHSVADADGLLIPHRLTQADLANMAGLARETVNV
ncbi:MAG: Crp/Fnr family transcriptional regulator, partial [Acidobacteria bacterium]|nr:Crp/Fnr family transcriptional regulator [Acidobacteriota bacterium]